jgi:6-pyruvoyltetrahydropterin/6-carboxytetrahydropterin synthase
MIENFIKLPNKNVQYITQKTNLDCGHRVMNERMKCYHLHGHTYLTELTFSFENIEEIGYAIDFKEVKRVGVQFLQDFMDHGMILNPHDKIVIDATKALGTKLWLMSLNGPGNYCNPSVENISKEVFLAMEILFDELYKDSNTGLKIHSVVMFETPNCSTTCLKSSITAEETYNFYQTNLENIRKYAIDKGVVEYDDRKLGCSL